MNLLLEPHHFAEMDPVCVFDRREPRELFYGHVYRILNKPLTFDTFVDHFYIQFPKYVYGRLLRRDSNIMYNHKPHTVGDIIRNHDTMDIEKIFVQYQYSTCESEITIDKINSILIWRIGYSITLDTTVHER